MATRNKNIKTYDLDSVITEYNKSIAAEYTAAKEAYTQEIEALNAEIAEINARLSELKTSLKNTKKARLDSRKSTDLKIQIENLEKSIASIKLLTEEEKLKVQDELTKTKRSVSMKEINLNKLINTDTSAYTDDQLATYNEKIEKAKTSISNANKKIDLLHRKLEKDIANTEIVEAKNQEIKELKLLLDVTIDSENSKFIKESTDVEEKFKAEFEEAKELSAMVKEKQAALAEVKAELSAMPKQPQPSLETFTQFLKDNKLSTVHAEELYLRKFAKLEVADIKTRKIGKIKDKYVSPIVKKGAIPLTITGAAVGATLAGIAASGAVGGTLVAGFVPVSANTELTRLAASLEGLAIGSVATAATIAGKNLLVRKVHYNRIAQNAEQNLEDYMNGTSIENLKITKFIEKTKEIQHQILQAKGPRKVALYTINRNRIHHIEAYTKDLYEQYLSIDQDPEYSNNPKAKAEKLKPIYELLSSVQDFIANDIAESRVHAMLTCKSKKKDSHSVMMFENADIYANLKIYLDRIAQIDAEHTRKDQFADAKKTTKNYDQKKEEACNIINGKKFITDSMSFDSKYKKYVATPSQGIAVMNTAFTDEGAKVVLNLANGKSISLSANDIDTTKKISTVKISKNKTTITYKDGTTQEITKKVKVLLEIETARITLADKLTNDPAFVEALKAEGFKTITINKLIEKINEWRAHTDEKFAVSGKIKNLYDFGLAKINTEAEITPTV